MKRFLVVALLAACGGSKEPAKPMTNEAPTVRRPEPTPPGPVKPTCSSDDHECAISMLAYHAAVMCECKDKACADRANEAYVAWAQDMAKTARPSRDRKVSEEMTKRMVDSATKYSECYTKLAMAGAGSGGAP